MLSINYSFPTNLPQNQWKVCYYIPELHKWNTHNNLDLESMLILSDMLIDLKRNFKVQSSNGKIFEFSIGTDFATLLNLFYITLSGRKNAVRHGR